MKRINIVPRDRIRETARLEEETSKYELLLMKLERKAKSAPVLPREKWPHFPQKNIKLPKIESKKFSGNILKWTEFWQPSENSIHNNPAVSNSDKFTYLKGCLEGAPLKTIGALDLSAENYNAAVAILKERYGRNYVIQKTHLRALETLTAIQDGFDAKGLKTFYEEVEGPCTGLLATGMEEERYSLTIIPKLLAKLSREVCRDIRKSQDDVRTPMTIKKFMKQLRQIVKLVSEEELDKRTENAKSGRFGSFKGSAKTEAYAQDQKKKSRSQSWSTGSGLVTKERRLTCLGNYKLNGCEKLSTPEERKEILKKYKRCFSHLNRGHLSRNCRSKDKTCTNCDKKGTTQTFAQINHQMALLEKVLH